VGVNPSAEFVGSLRQALVSARNRDGGWGYKAGKRSRLEPTAVALLALGSPRELADVIDSWPKRGSILVEPGLDGPNYTANALAAIVGLSASPAAPDGWVLGLLEALAGVEGRKTAPGDPAINRQDNAIRGWPWVDGTFSWAEPTAWCVLALKRGGRHTATPAARSRIDEGERLLIDRVCEPGGWNYGNSNVFQRNLPPYIPTTAIALLALRGRQNAAVSRSVTFLERHRLEEVSGMALALTAVCLGIYRRPSADVAEALQRQWARTQYMGNLHATALALYSVTGTGSGFEAFRA
jgi:hypothetical protein